MDRREFLAGAALTAGVALAGSAPAAAGVDLSKVVVQGATALPALKALSAAATACVGAGQRCQQHCAELLATGDPSMGLCNAAVTQMIALAQAASALAAARSTQLKAVLGGVIAGVQACEAACREHEAHWAHGMHLECKDCAEQCAALARAAGDALKVL